MTKRILYFAREPIAQEQIEKAKRLGYIIRNASMFGPTDTLENCDGVAGDAPHAYVERFGWAEKPTQAPTESPEDTQNTEESPKRRTRKTKGE